MKPYFQSNWLVEEAFSSNKRKLIEDILKNVLNRVEPSKKEIEYVKMFTSKLLCKIKEICKERNIPAKPELVGSTARNTWLKGDKDIDIFLSFPLSFSKEELENETVKIAKEITQNLIIKYAEHPYARLIINSYEIDLVPCFQIKSLEEKKSSVDRTIFHNRYLKGKITEEKAAEVRILKQFMKGIAVYGADAKTEGFSGYLCELLILHYGNFLKLLQESIKWSQREIINIERFPLTEKLIASFPGSLIVIDPVDKERNVAAAVSDKNLSKFIISAINFLKKPSLSFFFPGKTQILSLNEINRKVLRRGSYWLFIDFSLEKEESPDIIWPQLKKTTKKLAMLMSQEGVEIIGKYYWTNEQTKCCIIFETVTKRLLPIKKHYGPPVLQKSKENVISFLKKYENNKLVLKGPYLEGQRLVVDLKREETSVKEILSQIIKKKLNRKSMVEKNLVSSFKILGSEQIEGVYKKGLSLFLSGVLTEKVWV